MLYYLLCYIVLCNYCRHKVCASCRGEDKNVGARKRARGASPLQGLPMVRPYKGSWYFAPTRARGTSPLQGLPVLRPYKGSRWFAPTRAPGASPLQGLVVLRPYKGSRWFAPTRAPKSITITLDK